MSPRTALQLLHQLLLQTAHYYCTVDHCALLLSTTADYTLLLRTNTTDCGLILRTTAQYRGTDAADYCGMLDYCYCVLLRIHTIINDYCGLLRSAADYRPGESEKWIVRRPVAARPQ